MEFFITRHARERYHIDQSFFMDNGKVSLTDIKSTREIVHRINQQNDLTAHPEKAIKVGLLTGMALIDEIYHFVFSLYQQEKKPEALKNMLSTLQDEIGEKKVDTLFDHFLLQYPPAQVYAEKITTAEYLASSVENSNPREQGIENLILLWISTQNPALKSFSELIWDQDFLNDPLFGHFVNFVKKTLSSFPDFGPENQNLIEFFLAPVRYSPHSITGQLEYIREHWGFLLGNFLNKLLANLDLAREEEKFGFIGPGPISIPVYDRQERIRSSGQYDDIEAFSEDRDWMPRLVLIAKNIFVWLDQLSRQYGYPITTLDQIPDEELLTLSSRGITGLWLIGLWRRSPASARIKQMCGNAEAVSSAYSLYDYRISEVLGGDAACEKLKEKAARYGIRLASDMVPNHMGIDSEWVAQHPEWFLSVDECPFPSYSFTGPDLSSDQNIQIQIEDHYYDRTDAAVVFRRIDRRTGQTKYIYHGNDGTSMPWNDTAQLNYLDPVVREQVIETIIDVARKFPIIRFDAAMTLAKKHIQRLWYPEPGHGGAIPSRSSFTLTKEDFDRAIPKEFWREVVERIEAEAPDTLLLAEAFWLMEGYFVRTLGMHRVYNSAFMHMLRNEDNAGYRTLIKNTIEFEPEILKRFVNFMNNPDERTAIDQFGSGDKYFGVCTLMATMPGLPMFGHGQLEGFSEKYGMEYSRAFFDERIDDALMQRHQSEIFPLLYRRELFAGVKYFRMFDFVLNNGHVNENIFAFTNRLHDQRTLILYNNSFQETQGRLERSIPQSNCKTPCSIRSALNLQEKETGYLRFYDLSSRLFFLRPVQEIVAHGFEFHLRGYEHHVFVDFQIVHTDAAHDYDRLFDQLGWSGVENLDQALDEIRLQPVLQPLQEIINPDSMHYLFDISLHPEHYDQSWTGALQNKVNALLDGAIELSNTRENARELNSEIFRLITATVQFLQLDQVYAAPGTRKAEKILAELIHNSMFEMKHWCTLTSWAVVSRIGKLSTLKQYPENSLTWVKNWKLSRPLETTLRTQKFSDSETQQMVSALLYMIEFQNWYPENRLKTIKEILQKWFSSTEVQTYLKFNRFDGRLWYDHDAFQRFLWWMQIIPILQSMAEPNANRVSIAETILGVQEIMNKIRSLDKKSDCLVEKMMMTD